MNENPKTCRICLRSSKEQFSIHNKLKKKNLTKIIEEISGVVINVLKEPAASICIPCSDDILHADATIQKCKKSDRILLELEQLKVKDATKRQGDTDVDESIKHEQIEMVNDAIQAEINLEDYDTNSVAPEEVHSSPICIVADESSVDKKCIKVKQKETEKLNLKRSKSTRQLRKRAIKTETNPTENSTSTRKYVRKINVNKDYFFQCEQCAFTSYFATYFREHMQQQHNVTNPRIFKCQQCPQTFLEYRYLQQHIAYVHEQQPRRKKFLCSECGQGFDKSNHLYYHQRSHLPKEKRPVAPLVNCEHCNKEFSKLSIRMHIKNVHSAERPFACTLCSSSFALAKGLQAHMKICHPTELFICPCCEVRFRVRSVYETHTQRGTCKKLGFNCNYCAWGFKTQDRLKKHIFQVHKEMEQRSSAAALEESSEKRAAIL